MRIGHVTYTYEPISGGGDVYLDMLFRLLERCGHNQRVYQRKSRAAGPHLRLVRNPARGLPGEFWTQALFLLRDWPSLSGEQALIFHYPVYLLAGQVVRPISRPICVGISHGVTWDDRPGSVRSALKRAIARAAFSSADVFVANDSNFLRQMGLPVAPREQMFRQVKPGAWFIPNCVDRRRFVDVEPLADLQALATVLFPRNLYRNRGAHLAIEAFATFSRLYPETHLVLVGAANQAAYVRSLLGLVDRLGLGGRVIFRGAAKPSDMPRIHASARLTLVPSVAGEGTSLAALESMASGVATVCTRVGGLPDLPAVLGEPEPQALAAVMAETYERRREIGREQRAAVGDEYSLERWENAWLQALESAGVKRER